MTLGQQSGAKNFHPLNKNVTNIGNMFMGKQK